jgi:methenyltetrahydromethanopterin cyclohydrolase
MTLGEIRMLGLGTVTLSLNDRAHGLADGVAADADALRVAVARLPHGTRLIDCGSAVPGGLEAGRRFAEICMAGLGAVTLTPLALQGRWLPGLTVVTDHPALACLASQYAGWRLDRDGYFAMASGPGRALIRAEELYDDLEVDEHARTAVLCLETREPPPEAIAGYVAERAGVAPADLTLLFAPTASLAGGVQVAARVVETALHKLHELEFDVGRVVSGFGTSPLPPVSRTDPEAIGRTNDAVLYGGQVELTVDASDDELEAVVPRLPASASRDHGEPFGRVLERAGWDFYAIDPLLFSPAEVRLTSVKSGRSFHAGGVDVDVLERSFSG